MSHKLTLPSDLNQARGLAKYAIDFISGGFDGIDRAVIERTKLFHADSVACAISAIALKANAPTVLRSEALACKNENGAFLFGSNTPVAPEKAILANSSAAREWDSNGTNFGYNPETGDAAGEFGHNDFYPVAVAAAQQKKLDGKVLLRGMVLIDEIRGRLAEVFPLKNHKIDHVVHGAIASAAAYGAMMGATAEQIESAIGYYVAHHIPFRAIRAGKQLSDSKGASAAISTEAAIQGVHRSMSGFIGPADIFSNPQSIFRLFEPPFNLTLGTSGGYFTIMDMHLKLGLYEHQSAGAIEGLINLLKENPYLIKDLDGIKKIGVTIYEPAFGIICDPAKKNPRTRQSADHSLPYIIATLIRKAGEKKMAGWKELMLMPEDYDQDSIFNKVTRSIMNKIEIRHGGKKYDDLYPEGIPTSITIEHGKFGRLDSGLVKFPTGHARGPKSELDDLVKYKFARLAGHGGVDPEHLWRRLMNLDKLKPEEVLNLFDFEIKLCHLPLTLPSPSRGEG